MKKIHFIAIGGAIMHQLALALHRQGYIISGSDDEINDPARSNLESAGILPIDNGWFPEKITSDLDVVVLGMHAKKDNPELQAALRQGIPVRSFPEFMYEVSKEKKRVVIAGSHGKTTITSMVMHVLRSAGLAFDYMVGARVEGFYSSVQISDAPIIVMEGDEYPASALEPKPKIFFYHPHLTLISGIAWDHINVFPTYENYFGQFAHYVAQLSNDAVLIYNKEDQEVQRLIKTEAGERTAIPYSTPDYHYEGMTAVLHTQSGDLPLSIFGRHNLQNIIGAKEVCAQLGVTEEDFYKSISSYSGAARRLEHLWNDEKIIAFRDFAHAPSKLRATLAAVREAMPDRHLLAVFELHTYSSLSNEFLEQYKDGMNPADEAIVYFSQHALELKQLPLISEKSVKKEFNRADLFVVTQPEKLKQKIEECISAADKEVCLLLMSSGTFDGIDWASFLSDL